MWIVEVALRRPYTFLVMALLILLATPLVLLKMSTDIFPEINIPVISIVWNYTGLSAQEIGNRITAVNERSLTTTVNDIEHIESESLSGFSIIKIFFQPNANIPTAIAQVVAIEQSQLRMCATGSRRKPISCARTANAGFWFPSSKTAVRRLWTS
jgi:multidrug efflux pump subunit AcrB